MTRSICLLRRLPVPPQVQPRLTPLEAGRAVEPLEEPQARYAEGELSVLYRVAVFLPGRQPIAMPPIELIHPDGRVESAAGDTVWVEVGSVLPASDTALAPRPALEPIPRESRRLAPLVGLVAGVLGATTLWGFARRRTHPRPAAARLEGARLHPPVERWVAAGESRAVAALAAEGVRRRLNAMVPETDTAMSTEELLAVLEAERPEWPLKELSGVVRALERARFAPAVPSDVLELATEAERLVNSVLEVADQGDRHERPEDRA